MKTRILIILFLIPLLTLGQSKPKKIAASTAPDPDKKVILADLDKRFP